ncbi:hypothetical protein FRC12_006341 [Ceratobasidium sp. 428]|nr:hypothetical protein FRC12_006341 [Ceratobasidium sp. 428]
MRFHSEWRHPECPVVRWYSQQCRSSTKFQSIEHRRSLYGPFYHEFLLLKLTDGAVCRVERTGESSRADAIRYIGCTAYDLIQWFSKADYHLCPIESSELIAEVHLGREFDILDVLAVCYSIRNTKACRAYTLQRYNCYFLCLTVLAVLTRRVASWETKIKADEWDSGLASMCQQWENLSPHRRHELAILRICAYLEPDNPRRAQFIFDLLQTHLGSQAESFFQCNEAMRQTLWRTDWESGLQATLAASLEASPGLLEDMGYCNQQLKRAAETRFEDAGLAIMSCETLLAKNFFKIIAEEEVRRLVGIAELCNRLQRLWHIEHPVSFCKLALSRIVGSFAGPLLALSSLLLSADNGYERRLYPHISFTVAVLKSGSLYYSDQILDTLQKSNEMEALWEQAKDTVDTERPGFGIVRVLDRLASAGELPPSEVSLVLANWLNKSVLAVLLALLAAPGLNHTLPSLMELRQTEIQLALGGPKSDKKCMAIEDFQLTYIKHRITAHAKRVAVHQLAAAKFVIEDVEEAMREVWKGLPLGFGAVSLAPSLKEVNVVGSNTG